MTRLTMSVRGDPLTFRPVTSSIVRKSKDGDINVVIMLFGTHYNIKMDGILQQDTEGDIDNNIVTVSGSDLQLAMQRQMGGSGTAKQISTFSSFMYFFPGLKITGHLKLSEISHAPVSPELEGHYHFKDLLSNDEIYFLLARDDANLRFELIEVVDGVTTIIYTENLAVGIDEIYFDFLWEEQGRSKLFTYTDYAKITQTLTRKWIGNTNARIGECNVSIHHHNAEEVIHTVSSDLIFLQYPEIFLKFDREPNDRFVGHIRMWDDQNTSDEDLWNEIRSRDYKFIGNRVIENGMIRLIIYTIDPIIEIWGWNYEADSPSWEKCMTMRTDSDTDVKSLKIQNLVIEYFTKAQMKFEINFGTSLYSFIMTRGDPYVTLLNKGKTKFRINSGKTRMGGYFDVQTGKGYTLSNTFLSGSSRTIKASGTATCVSCVAGNTITINGIVYTGVSGVKSDNTEFSIDTGNNETALDLADSITNDIRIGIDDANLTQVAISAANVVTITCTSGGVSGNSILMSENSTTITLSGANLTGGAATGGTGLETLTNPIMVDNYFAFYNEDIDDDLVGWLANMITPTTIGMVENMSDIEYLFTYPRAGNIISLGVLPSHPTSLVGGIPSLFVVATQDTYVKWRANESVLSFKEAEAIKRR